MNRFCWPLHLQEETGVVCIWYQEREHVCNTNNAPSGGPLHQASLGQFTATISWWWQVYSGTWGSLKQQKQTPKQQTAQIQGLSRYLLQSTLLLNAHSFGFVQFLLIIEIKLHWISIIHMTARLITHNRKKTGVTNELWSFNCNYSFIFQHLKKMLNQYLKFLHLSLKAKTKSPYDCTRQLMYVFGL